MWTDQEALVVNTCEYWAREASARGITALSPVQRTALLPWWAKGIVDNGGFSYFYEGADLDEADEVADALTAIGLPEAAAACCRTRAVFPDAPQLIGQEYRIRWMEDHVETITPVFDEADRLFWNLEAQLFDALTRFIQANEAELRSSP